RPSATYPAHSAIPPRCSDDSQGEQAHSQLGCYDAQGDVESYYSGEEQKSFEQLREEIWVHGCGRPNHFLLDG
ncbi:hypothetical protein NSO96_23185, partial [Salmonella enterica]|nr:hypothetical protein [Salmonella enterica]